MTFVPWLLPNYHSIVVHFYTYYISKRTDLTNIRQWCMHVYCVVLACKMSIVNNAVFASISGECLVYFTITLYLLVETNVSQCQCCAIYDGLLMISMCILCLLRAVDLVIVTRFCLGICCCYIVVIWSEWVMCCLLPSHHLYCWRCRVTSLVASLVLVSSWFLCVCLCVLWMALACAQQFVYVVKRACSSAGAQLI